MRNYSGLDRLISVFDAGLRTLSHYHEAARECPSKEVEQDHLTNDDMQAAASLMRVNHAGEVAAQGLYHGQMLMARSDVVRRQLQVAAVEEGDHLSWCATRVTMLGSHVSYLTPVWYFGSLSLGALAGLFGDSCSLGFVAETELQVEQHLSEHLQRLPENDHKSRAIVWQMQQDEMKHGEEARHAGARELPEFIKTAMRWVAKLMTTTAARI